MPPRSKQPKTEWHQCISCDCTISSRDVSVHADICCQNEPLQLKTLNLSTLKHAFFSGKCFVGLLTVFRDIPDHLDKSTSDSLVFLHPSAMRLGGFNIGQPVVVDNCHVLTAWPSVAQSQTAVGVSQTCLDSLLKLQVNTGVLVHRPVHACVPATQLTLSVSSSCRSRFTVTQVFQIYVASKLSGKCVTAGNRISLTYYGSPCELQVSSITGEDHHTEHIDDTCRSDVTKTPDTKDPVRNLSQDLDNLRLNTSENCSNNCSDVTPKHHGLKRTEFWSPSSEPATPVSLPTQHRPFERLDKVFFVVNRRTKIVLDSDGDDGRNGDTDVIRTVCVDDVGGLDSQLATVTDMISLCVDTPEVFRQQGLSVPHGVLLYGPSGTGKSMLARAILSRSSHMHVVTVSGSEIWSKFYGESEARLIKFFKEARERAPSLMFIDELNAVCPRRDSSNNEVEKRVIACLVSQFDAMVASGDRVFVMTASNKRDDIDPALRRPGRLDKEVEVGVPSSQGRVDILTRQLRNVRHSLSSVEITSIAEQAHGFVGADLAAVCKEAGLHALKRANYAGSPDGAAIQIEDLAFGLGAVQPSAMREVAIEIPQVKWDDIGGQKDLKHKLQQAIEWPLKHPEAFKRLGIRPPRGLLMYGPPGCSKTMIAKALAHESGINFIAIKGPELFSKWVGESERAVREVFSKARAAAPAIVFFDEIDALAGERGSGAGGGGDVSDRVLAQLLTEMDGVEALKDVTVVAATNRPDMIDKALLRPGRLDRIVYVPLPDAQTRRDIFSIQFRKMPMAEDVDIEDLVRRTERYSGAEVAAVCHEAALCALTEDLDIQLIHSRHFLQAVALVTPRITDEMIDFYDTYDKKTRLHVV